MLRSSILPPGSKDDVASFVVVPGDLVVFGVGVQGSDRSEPGLAQSGWLHPLIPFFTIGFGTNHLARHTEGILLVQGYGYD